jgi:hypothetical protein
MRKSLKLITVTLAAPALLQGCGQSIVVTAEELCRSWRHQTVSKDDRITDGTAATIEGNNQSRGEWGCQPGQNKAKG